MSLLRAAVAGCVEGGHPLPGQAQQHLLRAALLLVSGSALTPRDHGNPLAFPAAELRDADRRKLSEQIALGAAGALSGKFEWLARMLGGIRCLNNAIVAAESAGEARTASVLRECLVRVNLTLALVDAVRSEDQALTLWTVMSLNLDECLAAYDEIGVWPPHFLGRALAFRRWEEVKIPNELAAWPEVAALARALWKEAKPRARMARQADRFVDLWTASQSSLPYYEAAIYLFYDALRREASLRRSSGRTEAPDDVQSILDDLRVEDEHRVGVLEMLTQFGHHLASRPAHLLTFYPRMSLREAVRQAVLSTRGQISIYPDRVQALWEPAAAAVRPIAPDPLGEKVMEVSFALQDRVEQALPSAFLDHDVVATALQLYRQNFSGEYLDLAPGWEHHAFAGSQSLLADQPWKLNGVPPGTTVTISERRIPGDELLRRILPGQVEWPHG